MSMPQLDLNEANWNDLLGHILNKNCIPFLGAGAAASWLPVGKDIARKWAEEIDYPMDDKNSLLKVAQFLAIVRDDDLYPKYKLADELKRKQVPDFSLPEFSNTIYAILADLNLPLYLTTNYDHFLENALKAKGKNPMSEILIWNDGIEKDLKDSGFKSVFSEDKYGPDSDNPLVYHLHGDLDMPPSMVLTESDYLQFQLYFQNKSFPTRIRVDLLTKFKLILGYSLEDTNIRIILSAFRGMFNRSDLILVLPPSDFTDRKDIYVKYLSHFYKKIFRMESYFANIQEFGEELQKRLNE